MILADPRTRDESIAGQTAASGSVRAAGSAAILPLDLATVLASRLCHDLAGLCGTLTGALELLGDASEPDAAQAVAVAVSHDAARALGRRLRLLRAAWGEASEPLDAVGLAALAEGLPGAPRVKLDIAALAHGLRLDPHRARVLLNALLLAGEALRGAGTIRLAGDGRALLVALDGARAGWPEALPALLADPDAAARGGLAEGPRGVQAPLLALLARDAGAALALVGDPAGAGRSALRLAWVHLNPSVAPAR